MIYEIRTYNFRPGTIPEWLANWEKAYAVREKYSPLGGMFTVDIGPLNQVVHLWQYDSLQQRADIRAAAAKDPSGLWPPKSGDAILSQESDILDPVKNMQPWSGAQKWGDLYELRMYTYAPGDVGKTAQAFGEAIEARNNVYPVAGIFTSQLGNLNRLYQLFPFKNWTHRDEVRDQMRGAGVWPPRSESRPVAQLVRHMVPTSFSPLH